MVLGKIPSTNIKLRKTFCIKSLILILLIDRKLFEVGRAVFNKNSDVYSILKINWI